MKHATLPRHGVGTRALHGLNALVLLILIGTGLALGDLLAPRWVHLLGGHLLVNATHRQVGLWFVIALVVLALLLPRRVCGVLRDVLHFRRGDFGWARAFACFYAWPRRHRAPFHAGRFDPAQRVVFLGILAATALVGASGVYIYLAPPFGRLLLAYAIRVHIAAAWTLIGCVCVHVVAGSGLLRTHRGLLRAMFGDGRVGVTLARTLWPGWATRQARPGSTVVAADRDGEAAQRGIRKDQP